MLGYMSGHQQQQSLPQGVSLNDFYAYMPMHSYIYAPSREMWPVASINGRIPPVPIVDAGGNPVLDQSGKQRVVRANLWLDQNKPVEQMTWAPGLPMLIRNRLISDGGERRDLLQPVSPADHRPGRSSQRGALAQSRT
jgi:hypothetical protein